jgi:hypothetical protein
VLVEGVTWHPDTVPCCDGNFRVQRHNAPSPNNEAITDQLEALLMPTIWAQQGYYRQLGLRDRILNLSLMVAAVLTLLWRQVPGVQELTRLLAFILTALADRRSLQYS